MRGKAKLRRIAKIYAAHVIVNAMGSGAYSELLSIDEEEFIAAEVEKIANRLTTAPLHMGELDQIIKFVDNEKS